MKKRLTRITAGLLFACMIAGSIPAEAVYGADVNVEKMDRARTRICLKMNKISKVQMAGRTLYLKMKNSRYSRMKMIQYLWKSLRK